MTRVEIDFMKCSEYSIASTLKLVFGHCAGAILPVLRQSTRSSLPHQVVEISTLCDSADQGPLDYRWIIHESRWPRNLSRSTLLDV